MNTIRVPNRLDPDQDRRFVGSDLGPICLQRLSADDKSPLARKEWVMKTRHNNKISFSCIYINLNTFQEKFHKN